MRLVTLHRRLRRGIVRYIIAVFIILQLIQGVYAQEVMVVVNPEVPVKELSRSTLRAIFSMRLRTWPDGSLIKVFVLSDDSSLHIQFSKKVLNIFPYQLRRTWDRLVYSGTGQAPFTVDSIQEMSNQVASTPKAIGYLPKRKIGDAVRVVQVVRLK